MSRCSCSTNKVEKRTKPPKCIKNVSSARELLKHTSECTQNQLVNHSQPLFIHAHEKQQIEQKGAGRGDLGVSKSLRHWFAGDVLNHCRPHHHEKDEKFQQHLLLMHYCEEEQGKEGGKPYSL